MDAYCLLECDPSATFDQLKTNYHRMLLRVHPDKNGNVDQFLALNTAYKLLSSTESRQEYDALRRQSLLKAEATALDEIDAGLLSLSRDFENDTKTGDYQRICRCGSAHVLKCEDLNHLLKGFRDRPECLVVGLECDTCSITVNVLVI